MESKKNTIVFINDHQFLADVSTNKIFTTGTLDALVWSRFTDNFGELTVIGRGKPIHSQKHTHKIASAAHVNFDLLYEVNGGFDYFKYKNKIVKKLLPYILNTDYIVLRLPSYIGVIAADLCIKYNKKYFVEVVGCAYDSMRFFGNLQGKILAPFTARQNRKAIKNASAAVYVTQYFLQSRYPNPNNQINASNVVLEDFGEEVLNYHIEVLKNNQRPFNIGMIGNIALPYKGYEILFKALKNIHLDYHLYIVGGGEPRWIKQQIENYNLSEKVTLQGRINNREEIMSFLDGLDLYVQPSFTEGLPRSVIEAMARACPIVASKAGGIPELIPENYLYEVKDYARLADLVQSCLESPSRLIEMSKENFYKSKEYTHHTINNRRYDFFQKIKNKVKN